MTKGLRYKTCIICGNEFEPIGNQVACSDACRIRRRNDLKKITNDIPRARAAGVKPRKRPNHTAAGASPKHKSDDRWLNA